VTTQHAAVSGASSLASVHGFFGADRPVSADGFFGIDGDGIDGGRLVPAGFATSPWGAVLHGRLIGGLAARAVEARHAADPDLLCTRLTIDMFRSASLAPVRVTAHPARSGRRIAVLDVTVEQDDGPIGQGRAVLLRRSEQPAGEFRLVPSWPLPAPPDPGSPPPARPAFRWLPSWQSLRVSSPPSQPDASQPDASQPDAGQPDAGQSPAGAPAGMWIREIHPLVTGEPLTPLIRLAMAADLVSPVANSSDRGLGFINADYTVYIGREPRGEYIGIQYGGHISERGVAVGQCVAHDLDGPVGFVATTAVANSMPGPPRSRA
jgi:hypothetical protein